ncbi:MAG: hypothetical protein ABIR66_03705, partial [Saprospiraceae bacterium]
VLRHQYIPLLSLTNRIKKNDLYYAFLSRSGYNSLSGVLNSKSTGATYNLSGLIQCSFNANP